MRFIVASAAAAATAGALLIGIPASGASAGTPAPGSVCASSSNFQKVQTHQTVSTVEREMGSVGDPTDGVTRGHGPGTSAFEEEWKRCGTAGLITFGVDYQADSGHPLTVVGKSELPTTRLG